MRRVTLHCDREDYERINMLFPFISAFVNKATKYTNDGDWEKLNSLHAELSVEIYWRP